MESWDHWCPPRVQDALLAAENHVLAKTLAGFHYQCPTRAPRAKGGHESRFKSWLNNLLAFPKSQAS